MQQFPFQSLQGFLGNGIEKKIVASKINEGLETIGSKSEGLVSPEIES